MAHLFPSVFRPSGRCALVFLLCLCLAGCSRKVTFNTSTIVPAAEGVVKIKKDKNNNHAIDIEVKNLADPKRLAVPQNVYVVWAETAEGVKNLGQLRTGSGLLSSTLRAELETVTPYKPNRFFITAESDAGITYPGTQVVLTTNAF